MENLWIKTDRKTFDDILLEKDDFKNYFITEKTSKSGITVKNFYIFIV
jgi:hypothetical protein